ncbi:hypothetical protein F511_38022 [Dorcoceras hygrometricum]|uniref:Uncharacterized protein n=1 Tax=Dorcoceras hygrometricum TaxID=472368 RepID=A0A2Z7A047_9LAMI|nr:hypothetical protein F511_38022 [Dorcoceras hygrometricum]
MRLDQRKKPKGLEVGGALLDPDKFEDPRAGDENNAEVPNGDDEGDGDPARVVITTTTKKINK